MNSLQFKKNEFKKFCATIGFKPLEIERVISKLDSHYEEWVEKKRDKETGEYKRYKNGTIKQRIIRPSSNELKIIQNNIKNRILATIKLPDCIHGGVKKRSNVSNAKPHQGNKYHFTTDLQHFYPNISSQKVYETFISLKFSPHYSHWLTKLTTWKYELPQGTPTSTHIANLVFLDTDLKLIEICKRYNLTYTRYVDDLTFSSPKDFQHTLNDLLNIVTNDGFKINYRKTRYSNGQTITGVQVFLNKIDAPEKILHKSQMEIKSNSELKPYTHYVNNIRKTNKRKKLQTNSNSKK